jgi:hypothetical protein
MAAAERVVALARRHQSTLLSMSARFAGLAGAQFDRLRPIGDDDLARWVQEMSPAWQAARTAAAESAVAQMSATVALDGVAAPAFDVAPVVANLRGGVLLDEVLGRPVVTVRSLLAVGRTVTDALAGGRAKAEQLAQTDLALAARDTADAVMDAIGITNYRRVPDPDACPFCLTAATQRYTVGSLMPLHERCGCVTAPIVGPDPGRILEPAALRALKAGTPDDARPRFRVLRDAELGARLVT